MNPKVNQNAQAHKSWST